MDVIPLIDCVFILLVFFIYSMLEMTMQRGIDVELPRAGAVAEGPEDTVVVSITAEGGLLVDREPVSLEQLGAAVENKVSLLDGPTVLINADARSEHRWFVDVVDELKRRGIVRIVILAEETPTP